MIRDHKKRTLIPFNFRTITDQIPELKHLNCHIAFHASHKAIDSSDVQPDFWEELATIIEKKYQQYDGATFIDSPILSNISINTITELYIK